MEYDGNLDCLSSNTKKGAKVTIDVNLRNKILDAFNIQEYSWPALINHPLMGLLQARMYAGSLSYISVDQDFSLKFKPDTLITQLAIRHGLLYVKNNG